MLCTMHLNTKTVVDLLSGQLRVSDQWFNRVLVHAVYDAAGTLVVSARAFRTGSETPYRVLNAEEIAREIVRALNSQFLIGAFSDSVAFYDTGLYDLRGSGQITGGELDPVHARFTAAIAEARTRK